MTAKSHAGNLMSSNRGKCFSKRFADFPFYLEFIFDFFTEAQLTKQSFRYYRSVVQIQSSANF